MQEDEEQHVGFRVAPSVNEAIERAVHLGEHPSKAALVHDAIRSGLALLEADPHATITEAAAAAGRHQFSVRLTFSELSRLEAQRTRIAATLGRTIVRVFVLRECLLRGTRALSR